PAEAHDKPLSFCKGALLVVPDHLWPAAYAERDMVFSAEDEKSRSGWRERKARHANDADVDFAGILSLSEAYAPGSCVAVPRTNQKHMGGDYDGDEVLLVSGLPALHRWVSSHSDSARELKGPKSHTPAYRDGRYVLGRAKQIV